MVSYYCSLNALIIEVGIFFYFDAYVALKVLHCLGEALTSKSNPTSKRKVGNHVRVLAEW